MVRIDALVVGVVPKGSDQKSVHLFVNTVLVDKNQNIQPLLYELQSEQKDSSVNFSHGFYNLPKGQFLFIGEVQSIDKKKKMIFLSNGGTVSYKHLVSANGVKSIISEEQDQEFSLIAKHLVDAVKIQKSIASSPLVNSADSFCPDFHKKTPLSLANTYQASNEIVNVAKGRISSTSAVSRHLCTSSETRCLEFQV